MLSSDKFRLQQRGRSWGLSITNICESAASVSFIAGPPINLDQRAWKPYFPLIRVKSGNHIQNNVLKVFFRILAWFQ